MQNEQLVCMAMGYLAGSFLTAVFVARTFAEKEISQIGTGNPGMANVMANIGKKEGVLVLAGDLVKVVIACRICQLFFSEHSFEEISLYTGFGAILGHNYPLWRKGKGGKGVAVTCAWLTLAFFPYGFLCCIAGGAAVLLTKSLAFGAVVIPFFGCVAAFLQGERDVKILAVLSLLLMFLKHRDGLEELLHKKQKTGIDK